MWRVTLKGVVAHKVRYALTALAVLLGVAFIAGTLVLTDTIGRTFDGLYTSIYQSTNAVVRGTQSFDAGLSYTSQRRSIDASLVSTVRSVSGVKDVTVSIGGYAQLVGKNGKAIGTASNGPPTLGEAWTNDPALNPLRLLSGGHGPTAANQIVIDKHSADVGHFSVGNTVTVLTKGSPTRYIISGIANWGSTDSPLGASIIAFRSDTAARVLGEPGKVDQINVTATPGVSEQTLVTRLRAAIHEPKVEVVSGAVITQEGQDAVHKALGFFNTILLVFALIALFVGSFLIFNTFSITVAQRMRELALLRAVGASRKQVIGAVIGESAIIGVVASAAGLAAGIGLAISLKAALGALGIDIPASGLVVRPRTVVVALGLGTIITVGSALLPALRAGRVPPVAAMQGFVAEPRTTNARRVIVGSALAFGGVAALISGLFAHIANSVSLVGGGAALIFLGISALGPLVVRPLGRTLAAPFAWRGVTGAIARENAVRNPSRTSSTAAALMIGVALVSLMSIVGSSTKASLSAIVDGAMKADFVVSSGAVAGGGNGLSPNLQHSLARLPQVGVALGIRSSVVRIDGTNRVMLGADPAHLGELFNVGVTQGSIAALGSNGIAVSSQAASDHHLALGSPVKVTFPTTGTHTFKVTTIYSTRELAGDYFLPLSAAKANFPSQLDFQVYVKLASGITPSVGRNAINAVMLAYPTATLLDQAQYKQQQAHQVDQLLNVVYALLALAILIALIGIANTLALSIYERTRELGLLRAIGMTRRQMRTSIRSEACIISLIGATEGVVVGGLFGWAMVHALGSQGITHLVVPFGFLAILFALAGLAGIVASMSPSRRAAKLNVLDAIATQ